MKTFTLKSFLLGCSLLSFSMAYASQIDDSTRDSVFHISQTLVKTHTPHSEVRVTIPFNDEYLRRLSDHKLYQVNTRFANIYTWNLWCPGTQGGFDNFDNAATIRANHQRIEIQKERLSSLLSQPKTIITTQEMDGKLFNAFLSHFQRYNPSILGDFMICQGAGATGFGVATFYNSSEFTSHIIKDSLNRSMKHQFTSTQGTFNIWNIHAAWKPNNPQNTEVLKNYIALTLNQTNEPTFITGDFNYDLESLVNHLPQYSIQTIINGSLSHDTTTAYKFKVGTTDGVISYIPSSTTNFYQPVTTTPAVYPPVSTQTPYQQYMPYTVPTQPQFAPQLARPAAVYPSVSAQSPYVQTVTRPSISWGTYPTMEDFLNNHITRSIQNVVRTAYQNGQLSKEQVIEIGNIDFTQQAKTRHIQNLLNTHVNAPAQPQVVAQPTRIAGVNPPASTQSPFRQPVTSTAPAQPQPARVAAVYPPVSTQPSLYRQPAPSIAQAQPQVAAQPATVAAVIPPVQDVPAPQAQVAPQPTPNNLRALLNTVDLATLLQGKR